MKRLARQVRARWRAFAGDADATREASVELWSLLRSRIDPAVVGGAALPRLAWPGQGRITSHFGLRHGRMHDGIDIAMPLGATVLAVDRGTVAYAGELGPYGNAVAVAHQRGLSSVYAHLARVDVAVGDAVDVATPLGTVGSSGRSFGPHLHLEVRFDGTAVDPLIFLGAPD